MIPNNSVKTFSGTTNQISLRVLRFSVPSRSSTIKDTNRYCVKAHVSSMSTRL